MVDVIDLFADRLESEESSGNQITDMMRSDNSFLGKINYIISFFVHVFFSNSIWNPSRKFRMLVMNRFINGRSADAKHFTDFVKWDALRSEFFCFFDIFYRQFGISIGPSDSSETTRIIVLRILGNCFPNFFHMRILA